METVSADGGGHVFTPEPYRATASQWWIACGEDDLFVGTHPKDFVRLDQRSSCKLLGSCPRRSLRLEATADLIDLDSCHATSFRDVVGRFGIVDRSERYPARAFEPLARGIPTAIGLAHLADGLVDHRQRDAVLAAGVTRRFQDPHIAEAGNLIDK